MRITIPSSKVVDSLVQEHLDSVMFVGKKYNKDQPRHPKGDSRGGQWSEGGSSDESEEKTEPVFMWTPSGLSSVSENDNLPAQAIGEIRKEWPHRNPFDSDEILLGDPWGSAVLSVYAKDAEYKGSPESIYVNSVRALEKGGGSAAMKAIIDKADEYEVPILLLAKAFGSGPNVKSQKQLVDWYIDKFGFQLAHKGDRKYDEDGVTLIRNPKSVSKKMTKNSKRIPDLKDESMLRVLRQKVPASRRLLSSKNKLAKRKALLERVLHLRKKYNDSQPRHPKGHPDGGKWVAVSSSGAGTTETDGKHSFPRDTEASVIWKERGVGHFVDLMESREDVRAKSDTIYELALTPHPVHGIGIEEATSLARVRVDQDLKRRQNGGFEQWELDEMEKWVKDTYANGAKDRLRQRKAVIVLGLPGAGKSSIIGAYQKNLKGLEIDADHFKKNAEGFDNGLGAMVVHERSSAAAATLISMAASQGDNVIIPKIGSTDSAGSITKLIDLLEKNGYEVETSVVHVTNREAQVRVTRRFLGTPKKPGQQMVPPSYVRELVGKDPVFLLDRLVKNGKVKKWTVVHNMVDEGKPYGFVAGSNSSYIKPED